MPGHLPLRPAHRLDGAHVAVPVDPGRAQPVPPVQPGALPAGLDGLEHLGHPVAQVGRVVVPAPRPVGVPALAQAGGDVAEHVLHPGGEVAQGVARLVEVHRRQHDGVDRHADDAPEHRLDDGEVGELGVGAVDRDEREQHHRRHLDAVVAQQPPPADEQGHEHDEHHRPPRHADERADQPGDAHADDHGGHPCGRWRRSSAPWCGRRRAGRPSGRRTAPGCRAGAPRAATRAPWRPRP